MDKTKEGSKRQKTDATDFSLQQLLALLTGVLTPDASLLAPIPKKLTNDETTSLENVEANHLALFERHIGPYHDVLDNAARHATNLWKDERFCFRAAHEPVNPERFAYPRFGNGCIEGPCPDPCVWIGLFFGREQEQQMREQVKEAFKCGDIEVYQSLMKWTVDKPKHELSVLELMTNVLRYLRQESDRRWNAPHMLRFCALYGLSGAMSDVLAGKYGPTDDITIDTMLPFKEGDSTGEYRGLVFQEMYMPAWSFGAALGHRNVVRHCIETLGADTNLNLVWKMKETGEMKEAESLPGLMLEWAIKTNQPGMVKCLVSEFGFQFRWLSDQMENLFEVLFHINRNWDTYGVWRPPRGYWDPDEEYMYDRDELDACRSFLCFKEKQKMLQAMIEVGFPLELLIPQINIEVEEEMTNVMKNADLDKEAKTSTLKNLFESLSLLERKARFRISDASAGFNVSRWYEEEPLDLMFCYQRMAKHKTPTLKDFYEMIVEMWKGQPTVQDARLNEFEKLDPRWTKYEDEGEEVFGPWWSAKSEDDIVHGMDG